MAHSKTPCGDCSPIEPGSDLDRMTIGIAKRFMRYCSENGCSQSEALAVLSATSPKPVAPATAPVLTRKASAVVAVRVENSQAKQIALAARSAKMSTSAFLRASLRTLASPGASTIMAKLIELLGLAPGSSEATVVAAVRKALGEPAPAPDCQAPVPVKPAPARTTPAVAVDPSSEAADVRAMSASLLTELARRGISPAQFAQMKRSVVRRRR
jgi:hypothetical protein